MICQTRERGVQCLRDATRLLRTPSDDPIDGGKQCAVCDEHAAKWKAFYAIRGYDAIDDPLPCISSLDCSML